MKFYQEIEREADNLGDLLTTLQDLPDIAEYATEEEMDHLWDSYDMLMDIAKAMGTKVHEEEEGMAVLDDGFITGLLENTLDEYPRYSEDDIKQIIFEHIQKLKDDEELFDPQERSEFKLKKYIDNFVEEHIEDYL